MKKNYLRIGLKSKSKLEQSIYAFLYEKHFDWAIILAAFFGLLPYIGSKSEIFLTIKAVIFSIIIYFCLKYITTWKELQAYYKKHDKSINVAKKLMDDENFKEIEQNRLKKYREEFSDAIRYIEDKYKANADPNITVIEFIQKNPKIAEPLLALLNEDKSVTLSTLGSTLGLLMSIYHIREIPRNELANYHRILYMLLMVLLFFGVYTIEVSF